MALSLADLSKARKEDKIHRGGTSILIYGDPRTGKTQLAGTIAKIPYIKRVFWFDLEKGIETLIYATKPDGQPYFTEEELAKITHINLTDTAGEPNAAITLLKAFTSPTPLQICQAHGVVGCKLPSCTAEDAKVSFHLRGCTYEDAVVIDSGSQLADSVLCMEKNLYNYKDLRRYYGDFTVDMGNIMSAIQAASTNVIMITHAMEIYEGEEPNRKFVGIFPSCGSQNFSRKVARSFGYIVFTLIELNKFKRGSGAMFKPKVLTGTRTGVELEASPDSTLVDLLMGTAPTKPSTQPQEAKQPATPTTLAKFSIKP